MAEMKIVGDGEVLIRLERRLAPSVQFQLRRMFSSPPDGCAVKPCLFEGYSAYRISFKKFTVGVKWYIVWVALDIGDWTGETIRNMGPTLDALKAA